jgi:release factor glutamine methyltransferase
MTVREARAEGTAALAAAGIASAALDSSLLLAEVLRMDRAALTAAGTDPLPAESLAAFRLLLERRMAGECTAYITGRKEFFGLDFAVNPSVLVPRPDTETLVEAAMAELQTLIAHNKTPVRVLDLGTGSGAVAAALKHEMPELDMWATDISPPALETAKANAARLLEDGRLDEVGRLRSAAPIRFLLADLFEALPGGPDAGTAVPRFDCIVSNPPYIPTADIKTLAREVQHEPPLALDGGGDGLAVIRNIVARAPDFLCPGGGLFMEADPRQMQDIAALLANRGFEPVQTYRDLSGRERVISGKWNTALSTGHP